MPGPPVSVRASAVSSTGIMPVHVELAGEVLFFVMCSAPSEAAGGDVAVGGGRAELEFGGAIVLEGVADAAVAGTGIQGGRDASGGADRDVAGLCAEHDRAAHGLGDPDVAPCGADLRGAVEPADLDVAVHRIEADARGLVDLDLAVRAFEGDVAKASDAAELGAGGPALDA